MEVSVVERIFTHADVRRGIEIVSDSQKIGEYTKQPGVIQTFLTNPRIEDENEPLLLLGYLNGDVCGRMFYFPTKIKIGDRIENSLGASALLVSENAREYSVGANLMMYPIKHKYKKYLLYAGISKMAEPLYHKLLKFEWFSIPRMLQFRNGRILFQKVGLHGLLLKFLSFISNLFVKPMVWLSIMFCRAGIRNFKVVKLESTPQWVEDIVFSDSHKYSEYHDRKWFEWVLSNNFFQHKEDNQSLYGIYQNDKPLGFVLIKERLRSDSFVWGTVVEWGSSNEKVLDEYLINKIALTLYSKNVDIAQANSIDKSTLRRIKKYGFVRHGNANIAFRDLTKELDKDYKNINNWRIRLGYSDVAFF